MKSYFFKLLILTAAFAAVFLTTVSYAAFTKEQEGGPGYVDNDNNIMNTEITIVADTENNTTMNVSIPWSDDWFGVSSSDYNGKLALVSAALDGTAYFKDKNGLPSGRLAEAAFKDLGFDPATIRSYNYDYPYTENDNDAVAFTIAAKKIGDTSLVALVARGTTVQDEWVSNLRLLENSTGGETPVDHYGFFKTADNVYEDLCKYLEDLVNSGNGYSYKNIIFYITGHSRGGAIANVLAARLDDLYGKDRVFAYPIAVPAVSSRASEDGYENIFNIMGAKDDVVLTAFKEIGFKRFGRDVTIPADAASGNFTMHSPATYCEMLAAG